MASLSKGEVSLVIGGSERTLRLSIGDIEELESRLNSGAGDVLARFQSGWALRDVSTIVQLAMERCCAWKGSHADMLGQIKQAGVGPCAYAARMLLLGALVDIPDESGKNADAPERQS